MQRGQGHLSNVHISRLHHRNGLNSGSLSSPSSAAASFTNIAGFYLFFAQRIRVAGAREGPQLATWILNVRLCLSLVLP